MSLVKETLLNLSHGFCKTFIRFTRRGWWLKTFPVVPENGETLSVALA